uniref:Neutral amino acid transporter n=1 Tax=Echinococcus granulosus TaxID=6210 RepID=A0A068WXX0_ECHGR|nr:neutral amino acid transporter [Echinococcus granulosus]
MFPHNLVNLTLSQTSSYARHFLQTATDFSHPIVNSTNQTYYVSIPVSGTNLIVTGTVSISTSLDSSLTSSSPSFLCSSCARIPSRCFAYHFHLTWSALQPHRLLRCLRHLRHTEAYFTLRTAHSWHHEEGCLGRFYRGRSVLRCSSVKCDSSFGSSCYCHCQCDCCHYGSGLHLSDPGPVSLLYAVEWLNNRLRSGNTILSHTFCTAFLYHMCEEDLKKRKEGGEVLETAEETHSTAF